MDPLQQAEDYHDAVIYAGSIEGVDRNRIVIWGIGHSGGAAMISASNDPNIKAVILVMPFFSGKFDENNYPEGMMERVWAERRQLTANLSAKPEYVQVWDNSESEAALSDRGQILLLAPTAYKFIKDAKALSDAAGTPWENKMSLQSFYAISKVEPQDHIRKIKCALLYLAAKEDEISGPIELERATFDKARAEQKHFGELEGLHIANYKGRPFDINVKAQIDFLQEHV